MVQMSSYTNWTNAKTMNNGTIHIKNLYERTPVKCKDYSVNS